MNQSSDSHFEWMKVVKQPDSELPIVSGVKGDSKFTSKMLKSENRPKDVFKANRINAALANIQEMQEQGVKVTLHLVRSQDNASDICT